MSEEDLRIQQIKMKIKGLTFEQARDISNLCSEYYIEGLEQSRFDKRMLEVELSGYRQAILQDKELMGLKEDKDRLQQENQQLKEKIKTYEDPEDMTLMYMWCNEKAKDKIKQLKEVIVEVREYIKYYLLDNSWFKDSQKEFEKLLQILDKVKGE